MDIKLFRDSRLAKIKVKYGDEVFTFNLIKELQISEHQLSHQLKTQPSMYGFALLLQKKLNSNFERLRQDRKKTYGRLYLKAKERLTSKQTKRGYSDEAARAYVLCHPTYVNLTTQCIEAKDMADTMFAVIRSFEQRKDLMQTISSNNRKEKDS